MWSAITHQEDTRVIAIDALVIAFFLNASHTQTAESVLEAIDAFVAFAGLSGFRYSLDEEGEAEILTPAAYQALRARFLQGAKDTGEGGIRLVGDEVHLTGMRVYHYGQDLPRPKWPHWRNVLTFHLSRSAYLEKGPSEVRGFARTVAQRLPFSFGYASPCVLYHQEINVAAKLARRFPGMDILNQTAAAASLNDKVAGVYWLSFFGPTLGSALGGAQRVRAALSGVAEVTELSDGKVELAIGEEPEVGDRNRKLELPAYRVVARFLEPYLDIPEVVYFFEDDGITPDRQAMVDWHRRFLD